MSSPQITDLLGEFLVDKDGNTHKTADRCTGLEDGLLIYFSAQWCGPCKQFTPKLVDVYKKYKALGHKFEVVFVSRDRDEEAFKKYFGEMPWLAVQFDQEKLEQLCTGFQVQSIPSLMVLNQEYGLISRDGRQHVEDNLASGRTDIVPWCPPDAVPPPEDDEDIEGTMRAAAIGAKLGGVASVVGTGMAVYNGESVGSVVKVAASACVVPFVLCNGVHIVFNPGKEGYISMQFAETIAVFGVAGYVGSTAFKAAKELGAVPQALDTIKMVGAAMVGTIVVSGMITGAKWLAGYAYSQLAGEEEQEEPAAAASGAANEEALRQSVAAAAPSSAGDGHGHSHGDDPCHGPGPGPDDAGAGGDAPPVDEQQKVIIAMLQKIGMDASGSLEDGIEQAKTAGDDAAAVTKAVDLLVNGIVGIAIINPNLIQQVIQDVASKLPADMAMRVAFETKLKQALSVPEPSFTFKDGSKPDLNLLRPAPVKGDVVADEDRIKELKVTTLSAGDGKTFPKKGDTLSVHYTGKLASNGKVFDSSQGKDPIEFPVGMQRVVPGWDQGFMKVSLGEKAMLEIPASLAYGDSGAGGVIPSDADLVFEVELLAIN